MPADHRSTALGGGRHSAACTPPFHELDGGGLVEQDSRRALALDDTLVKVPTFFDSYSSSSVPT